MKFNIDTKYLINCFKSIIDTPSPTEYYVRLNPVLEKHAEALGLTMTFDNRNNAYITLDGEDNSKTVLISAHADTIGLMVKKIEPNGTLRVSPIGGINFATLEGETVTVHTRSGKDYTGLFLCQSHSVHVFSNTKTLERRSTASAAS
jgi:putative aminopeptidase FrvX